MHSCRHYVFKLDVPWFFFTFCLIYFLSLPHTPQRRQCPGLLFYNELLHIFYRLRLCDYKNAAPHVDNLDAAMKIDMQQTQRIQELVNELNALDQSLSRSDLHYRDRTALSKKQTMIQEQLKSMTGLCSIGQESLQPVYFGNVRRIIGDKLQLAPPPIDGEWLPKSAVYALVDLIVVVFGRPKGLFKECAKRIQSGMNIIQGCSPTFFVSLCNFFFFWVWSQFFAWHIKPKSLDSTTSYFKYRIIITYYGMWNQFVWIGCPNSPVIIFYVVWIIPFNLHFDCLSVISYSICPITAIKCLFCWFLGFNVKCIRKNELIRSITPLNCLFWKHDWWVELFLLFKWISMLVIAVMHCFGDWKIVATLDLSSLWK